MKTMWIFILIAAVSLIYIKIAEYINTIKIHKKRIQQLEGYIIELKIKQNILNQQVKMLQLSDNYQKSRLNAICLKIYDVVEKFSSIK